MTISSLYLHGGNMREQGVLLTGAEMEKFRVCKDILDKNKTQKEAAQKLNLSERQVRRLARKVKEKGAEGIVHGLVGKIGNNAIKSSVKEQIKELWITKYSPAGFNISHFTEKLLEVECIKVSKDFVRRFLRKENLLAKAPLKRKKYHKQRPRREAFGELLQLDTSPHDWLSNGTKLHLVDVIDDATSQVLYAQLFESDGTIPNMVAMESICRNYGVPAAFYVDRASWFSYNFKSPHAIAKASGKEYETQIQSALKKLGVELILAYSPQAKGRIERNHRTYQDRLIAEFKLHNIKDRNAANEYLRNVFIPATNQRFAKDPQAFSSQFIPLANPDCLREIFCMSFKTKVKNDNTVSKKDRYTFQLLSTAERVSWAQAPVEIRLHTDYSWSILHVNLKQEIPFKILFQNIPDEYKYGLPLAELLKVS